MEKTKSYALALLTKNPLDFDHGTGFDESWELTILPICESCGKVCYDSNNTVFHIVVEPESDAKPLGDTSFDGFFYELGGVARLLHSECARGPGWRVPILVVQALVAKIPYKPQLKIELEKKSRPN